MKYSPNQSRKSDEISMSLEDQNFTEILVSNRTKGLLKSNLSLSKINISYDFITNPFKMSFNIFFICSLGYHNLDYGKIESIFSRSLFRLTDTTQMSWKT